MPENTETAGGTRYSAGKPAGWWYVPMYGLRLVARVAMHGAEKYAPMDWRNGQSFSTLFDCMMRHLLEVQERGPYAQDEDTGCYHLAHAAWNILALLTFMALGRRELDDITPWQGVTAAEAEWVRRELESEESTSSSGSSVAKTLPDGTKVAAVPEQGRTLETLREKRESDGK